MELTCAARCPCLHRRAASRSAASFPEAAGSNRARPAAPCCVPNRFHLGTRHLVTRRGIRTPPAVHAGSVVHATIHAIGRTSRLRREMPPVAAIGRGPWPRRISRPRNSGHPRGRRPFHRTIHASRALRRTRIGKLAPSGTVGIRRPRHPAITCRRGHRPPARALSLHILAWRPALPRTRAEALKALVVPGTGSPFSLLCREC